MILHVDMDAFYASVEERDRPELVGSPVIVGGSRDTRGVVSAANYVARKFGVHSAMPMVTAMRLCPQAVVLPVRMSHYAAVSRQIRDVFHRYTPLVEPLSLDEAFLDVAGTESLFGPPEEIAVRIKQDILVETQLVASVGVAPNKFLAKVASDLEKPDGLTVVDPNRIQGFLDPLPVSRLWGVGRKAEQKLKRVGIDTVEQLRRLPESSLAMALGERAAAHLHALAHGRDNRRVIPDREAKSISHETTFAVDVYDEEMLLSVLVNLSDQVGRRLRRNKLSARTVNIKIRFSNFETITRSQSLRDPTDSDRELAAVASELFAGRVSLNGRGIRLIGMGTSGFEHEPVRQKSLFDEQEILRNRQLGEMTDLIRDRFGSSALRRGNSSGLGNTENPDRPE
jgi:DNA polymerase-4